MSGELRSLFLLSLLQHRAGRVAGPLVGDGMRHGSYTCTLLLCDQGLTFVTQHVTVTSSCVALLNQLLLAYTASRDVLRRAFQDTGAVALQSYGAAGLVCWAVATVYYQNIPERCVMSSACQKLYARRHKTVIDLHLLWHWPCWTTTPALMHAAVMVAHTACCLHCVRR